MNTTAYALDAYHSRDLSIQMRTSSGDTISMDFNNTSQLQMQGQNGPKGQSGSFSFASMQSYQFSIDSNGLSEQDKKEIDAFMEIARPYIEDFMKEVGSGEQTTPLNKRANTIADLFAPLRGRSENMETQSKNGIVSLFDNALKGQQERMDKLISESQKLLDKVLQSFDKAETAFYA